MIHNQSLIIHGVGGDGIESAEVIEIRELRQPCFCLVKQTFRLIQIKLIIKRGDEEDEGKMMRPG